VDHLVEGLLAEGVLEARAVDGEPGDRVRDFEENITV